MYPNVFGPALTPVYPLKMAKIKNSHRTILSSCPFGVQMDPGSKIKRSQLRLAPFHQKPVIKGKVIMQQSVVPHIKLVFFQL